MDLDKLSTGDKIMGGAGIGLFLFSFLPWFTLSTSFGSASQNGWDYFFTGIVPLLIGLALVAYVAVVKAAEAVELPELPVEHPVVVMGFAVFAALLVVLRFLLGDDIPYLHLNRGIGLFLSVIAAITMAVGSFLSFKESGASLPGGSGGGTGSQPPTPF